MELSWNATSSTFATEGLVRKRNEHHSPEIHDFKSDLKNVLVF